MPKRSSGKRTLIDQARVSEAELAGWRSKAAAVGLAPVWQVYLKVECSSNGTP